MKAYMRLSAALPLLLLFSIVAPTFAADNGSGSSGNPQADFCDGLYQSCRAGCDAIDGSTLAGGVAKRKCRNSCLAAHLSCWANAKKTGRPTVKKQ